ncbi:MAG: cysteine--tRNA ligase [Candidatus Ryanbacteria bacterium]|nr:cysteine--tRNA ligase [Candidatus Ryanbacteria bacterium]
MAVTLFDSLTRSERPFEPLVGATVRLYTCGPTVYRSQHIGNYRTFIFEDTLRRMLLASGWRVKHVMNITDVGHLVSDADDGEDKVEREARLTGKTAWDIAKYYEKEFIEDIAALNILPPTKLVRATEHITEQRALIKILEKKGFTYRTADGIYFDTSKLANYGELAGRDQRTIQAGSRVAIGEKQNSTDFALWKFSKTAEKKRDMEWPSPWGVGFPGWHIECSAMSMKYLGKTLDIHCGGADHREIHHPNEIAQSEAATGKTFSRFWMHSAFLTVKGEKMAKSSPETNITIAILRERGFDPLDFRYFVLGTHYRKPLSFSWEALEGARTARLKLVGSLANLPKRKARADDDMKKDILAAFADNLAAPQALARLWQGIRESASRPAVLWADHLFGLNLAHVPVTSPIPLDIQALADAREAYRQSKDWQKSDEMREKLTALGWRVEDTPHGPVVHKI